MTVTVEATWKGGVLQPKQPVALPDGADVRVSIFLPDPVDRDPLADVIGIGDGPAAGDAAKDHDRYLYGASRP
jgi:predicted DNA-binding antitoxin AbrB/MazE fold protein